MRACIQSGLCSVTLCIYVPQCMHENKENPPKCKDFADDYLECLHHRKYVSSTPLTTCTAASAMLPNRHATVDHRGPTEQTLLKAPKLYD